MGLSTCLYLCWLRMKDFFAVFCFKSLWSDLDMYDMTSVIWLQNLKDIDISHIDIQNMFENCESHYMMGKGVCNNNGKVTASNGSRFGSRPWHQQCKRRTIMARCRSRPPRLSNFSNLLLECRLFCCRMFLKAYNGRHMVDFFCVLRAFWYPLLFEKVPTSENFCFKTLAGPGPVVNSLTRIIDTWRIYLPGKFS